MLVGYRLAALLLLSGASVPVAAQDAQSLIAKNIEARGGAAALAAIKSVSFTGRTIFPGDFEMGYKETRARVANTSADRVTFTLQGLDIIQAYDGRAGWKINPLQGRKDAETMSADEARSLADTALVDGPLIAARTDGSTVTYLGREDFDGTLAYKLKVSQKDGDSFTYWLDPDTYLEIKIDETRKIRGAQQTTESELGDYEKVAGVYFPMSVESWSLGESNQRSRTIVASATANGAIAANYFAEPRGAGVAPAGTSGEPPEQAKPPKAPDASKPTTPAKPGKGE